MKRWGLCWWAWALAATAVADTHYVSPTGTCIPPYTNWVEAATNIQDAVSEASDGDVVEVAAGTYESTGVQLDEQPGIWNVVAVTNAIELRGDFTATIQPPMSAPGWIRCVYLCSNAILSGFNLSDGRLADGQSPPGTDAAFGGGGVYGPGAIVTDCTIQDCVAPVGGAVCGPTVLNCTLLDNWAGTGGGAISAHLANCWMNYNRAQYDGGGAAESRLVNCGLSGNFAGGQGGGLFMGSATGCIFQGAAPGPGGGIGFATYGAGAAQSTLDNCTLQGLVASFEGGGAYNCQLTACSIIGNQANSGGGVAGLPYNTRVTSCTVQGNWASRSGGGIYGSMVGLEMMQIPVENCIIEANSSGDGAGVSGSCLLTGCTVRANTGSAVSGSSTLLDCLINGNMGGVLNPVRMERCTLSGNSGRVLEAFMASSTLIRDCVIVSNYFSWTGGTGTEGGLSSLSLINTRIEDNDGQLVMSQCTVEGSRIAGNELLTMLASDFTNCVIEANTCQSTDGCDFFDCTISGNTSSLSAIRNSEVWRSTITGNWGDEAGAGIDSSFHDCTISSNRSPKMAAVGSLYGGPPTQFLVIGCLLEGNVQVGGNIIGGIAGFVGLTDCRILNNISEGGSTLYYCNAQRCLIAGNRAHLIGGANGGELRESTVVNNVASNGVGGAEACSAFDSIIYHNTGAFAANWTITNDFSSIFSGVVFSHCCTDPLRADEFTDETGSSLPPRFVNPSQGDFRLGLFSPYRGAGIGALGSMGAISLQALLEGASGTGNVMRADLSAAGEFPLTSPYRDDSRSVVSVPTNAVDWVLVRLLETNNLSSVYTRSLLLLASGELADESGSTDLRLTPDHEGPLRVVLQHRNHLPVLSVSTLANSNESFSLDFRLDPAQVVGGTNALVETQPGAWALRGGDPDGDGRVTPTDRLIVERMMGMTGYLVGDLNLDGVVNDED